MHRNEMIRRLTEATLQCALDDPSLKWLREMLTHGFIGYSNMRGDALTRELQLRGLIEFDDPEPQEEFDDDEDIEDDDEEEEDERERVLIPYGTAVVRRANASH